MFSGGLFSLFIYLLLLARLSLSCEFYLGLCSFGVALFTSDFCGCSFLVGLPFGFRLFWAGVTSFEISVFMLISSRSITMASSRYLTIFGDLSCFGESSSSLMLEQLTSEFLCPSSSLAYTFFLLFPVPLVVFFANWLVSLTLLGLACTIGLFTCLFSSMLLPTVLPLISLPSSLRMLVLGRLLRLPALFFRSMVVLIVDWLECFVLEAQLAESQFWKRQSEAGRLLGASLYSSPLTSLASQLESLKSAWSFTVENSPLSSLMTTWEGRDLGRNLWFRVYWVLGSKWKRLLTSRIRSSLFLWKFGGISVGPTINKTYNSLRILSLPRIYARRHSHS